MAAFAVGYPIVTGCHNTHRLKALREIGGFAPHQADDLLITRNYHAAGWAGVYIPEIMARGLAPEDLSSYLVQQQRWARSVFDLKFRPGPKSAKRLTIAARLLGYFQGYQYLFDSILASSCVWILLIYLAGYDVLCIGRNLAFIGVGLFVTGLYTQQLYLDPNAEAGLHWRAFIVRAAKWPYTLKALCDVIRNRHYSYQVTPKGSRPRQCVLWPQLVLAFILLSVWIYRIRKIHDLTAHVAATAAIAFLIALAVCQSAVGATEGCTPRTDRESGRPEGLRDVFR
jgi:cellulose synthase (UDP-forming)